MFHALQKNSKVQQATTPDLDDEDSNSISIIDDNDVDVDVDVDVDEMPTQKPHFLDYDAVPPPDFEESFDRILSFGIGTKPHNNNNGVKAVSVVNLTANDETTSIIKPPPPPAASTTTTASTFSTTGEQLKLDKKYERDGEISDYELAASGYTKKEFTQDDNTLHLGNVAGSGIGGGISIVGNQERTLTRKNTAFAAKPKHFLDENPIPPDYMLDEETATLREHRSLDRNFERHNETQKQQQLRRTESPVSSLSGGGCGGEGGGRMKNSFDRSTSASGSRSSRERFKEQTTHHSYSLSRFLDSADAVGIGGGGGGCPSSSSSSRVPKAAAAVAAAWTDSFIIDSASSSRYGNLQLSSSTAVVSEEVGDSFGPKVECVYSLLSMLGSNDPLEMSKKFLELSRTTETCATLRRSGCIPLLVQMMHSAEGEESVRKCASMALHNVVHSHPDEKAGRREAKVLRLLDQIMEYCNFLKTLLQSGGEAIADDSDRHPLAAISSLMKVSFDEEHRHAMCELGALQAIPSLVHLDHAVHGPKPEDQCCNSLRRYALMALTNLTFGDENNKALLCSQKLFMEALVGQLDSAPDDLLQVTASVLRNLSWRADSNMKAVLNEIGTVTALARAAMKNKSENTLKAILSALWNLSAHCSTNKAEFCAVDGALAFLVEMLTYEGPSKTLKIIENAGGILRNVSSHIAVREHYRQILREHNCLAILLQQLKSESLTVVSNSCGTLWNLSARCPEDQKFLWDNGAVPMLRSLIHSKHSMISEGSSSALKNLLNFRPSVQNQSQLDPIARSMGLKKLPSLNVRKQKALEQELGSKEHAETCDNLDIIPGVQQSNLDTATTATTSLRRYPLAGGGVLCATGVVVPIVTTTTLRLTRSAMLTKSESRDSVFSVKSDSVYENLMRSHSASDANRKTHQPQKLPFHTPRTAFALENVDVEPTEEQPIDYSVKYNSENAAKIDASSNNNSDAVVSGNQSDEVPYAAYQETDLDQPTDFSLRYAENQNESDVDILPPDVVPTTAASTSSLAKGGKHIKQVVNSGNEMLLILEDSVKCYQTEDTPYVISNAASVTDLRQNKGDVPLDHMKSTEPASVPARKYQKSTVTHVSHHATAVVTATVYGSGSYTPEKPINYCEEGTPGYFSRYESLSSLEESPPLQAANANDDKKNETLLATDNGIKSLAENCGSGTNSNNTSATINMNDDVAHVSPTHLQLEKPIADTAQMSTVTTTAPNISASVINSAQETPLMFSRHSSMDSLVEEDIGPCDDKSSVVSDFSRLASGVISPSDLPDSPTQSMPQSPRRNSACGSGGGQGSTFSTAGASPIAPRSNGVGSGNRGSDVKPALQSVFEDNLNMFNVENTPAQFSTATSLSNLSILDDENINSSTPNYALQLVSATVHNVSSNAVVSEGEEEDNGTNNDDLLLASCINMGMNRASAGGVSSNIKKSDSKSLNTSPSSGFGAATAAIQLSDEPKQYYTEDTPALLSKVASNTNLSAISICSSNNDELKDNTVYEISSAQRHHHASSSINTNRHSLNLSDDVSSNASECGGAGVDILQQCIRDGMKKPQSSAATKSIPAIDPIAMMRRGGNMLPPYLPITDETSKYVVEDSPCNFSVASGLSNLTVGSSLVGPAVQLKENKTESSNPGNAQALVIQPSHEEDVRRREQQWQDDSLSSLSIDSEDDTNLLSQAIAAGCNRPKSNLGFSSSTSTNNKRSTSLSASQPIPINSATSASSLTSTATGRVYQKQHHQQQHQIKHNNNGNESFSSVDSSDSNDNQSKSLFELCILTGMHKSRDVTNSRRSNREQMLGNRGKSGVGSSVAVRDGSASTQSNPNLKQFDSLPMHVASSLQRQQQQQQPHHQSNAPPNHRHRKDDRERKDERLLQECINTGISKKIAGAGGVLAQANDNTANSQSMKKTSFPFAINASAVPKNVQATSAAALEPHHPTAAITFPSANSTAAAPGVEKNIDISTSINTTIITHCSNENMNENNFPSLLWLHNNITINPGDIINDQSTNPMEKIALDMGESRLQNHENVHGIVNGIGCKDHENDDNLDSELSAASISPEGNTATTSDDSNESFIMETTVSLDNTAQQQSASFTIATPMDKHKDPDLMLKSVERLTFEFVSSAEQLRTGSNASDLHEKRHGSISYSAGGSGGGGNSTSNTWNENTCPNDVSFPSVSVSAPVVASLKYDDDDDDDDEQATEADHRELHDFAEITPTNEEQPAQPSLSFLNENELYAETDTQPNSLDAETETETLINDEIQALKTFTYTDDNNSGGNNSGINFQLGGEVQSAAAAVVYTGKHMFFSNANGAGGMTNSTIIAIEARALAENLHQTHDDDDDTDLTFSISSLDLDNIRPPSGMESLNISGFYQELSPGTQPNSLQRCYNTQQQSPQLSTKSPKFPRKSLLPGLVAKRALGQLPGHLSGSAESVNSSCNLLDNIKPPSLMDELLDSMISVASIQSEVADCESMATTVSVSNYETAAGCNEFDDNTVTLQSCYDLTMPHDDADEASLNGSGTPLPSDYEFSSAESTPKKSFGSGATTSPHGVKRTLTPKQKRKLAKDRFKPYTIAADIVLSEEQSRRLDEAQQDETLQIEIIETDNNQSNTEVGSANRRRTDEDRYKTQTIIFPPHALTAATVAATKTTCFDDDDGDMRGTDDLCSLTSTDGDDGASDDISSIRAMTKQFKFISAPITPKTLTVAPLDHSLTANAQPAESDYTSVECDQSSETESSHGQNHNDALFDTERNDDYENETEGDEKKKTSIVRPRIAKPDDVIILNENKMVEEPKAIRGRKKPPYISPYSMQYQQQRVSAATTVQTTRISATTIAFRKRNSNAAAATTAAPTSAFKMAQKKKTNEVAATAGASATFTASTVSASLERQGTFVQDEPTITAAQVPIVEVAATGSASTSQQSSPTQRMSKLPMKRPQATKTTISPKFTSPTTTIAATRKIPTSATSTNMKSTVGARRTTATTTGAVTPQRSNSNATIRVTSNAARIAVLSSRVSTTTPPSRSNSNLNSNNTAAATTAANAVAKSSTVAKINQAQSRIAGIWKRVDDAKTKQQQQQHTQQKKLNTTNKLTSASNSNLKTQQTNSSSAQKQKLIRSSTFDNTPIAVVATTTDAAVQDAERLTAATATKTKVLSAATATSKIAFNGGSSGGASKISNGKTVAIARK